MTPSEKVTKAKIQLILSQPFFATLLLGLKVTEANDVEKLATDGECIFYNPDYVEAKEVEELKGNLCAAIMSTANLHNTRREGRDPQQWNEACEFAVNTIVKEAGLKLPKEALFDRDFTGLSAEQVFTKRGSQKKPDPKGQQGGNGQGNKPGQQPQPGQGNQQPQPGTINIKDSKAKTQAERHEQEAKMKRKLTQAAMIGKKAGKMPGSLQSLIDEILKPAVNWKEVLNRFIYEQAKNDYSFSHPNPRFLQSGFFMPSLRNEEPGRIVFIVDTSCSVQEELFKQFCGELHDVCSELKTTLTVIQVDTKVQNVESYEPDEEIKRELYGRGGTDFAPGFEYIETEGIEAKAIVYLTDGECHSYPDNEPEAPTLWVKYGSYTGFEPPFGEITEIE